MLSTVGLRANAFLAPASDRVLPVAADPRVEALERELVAARGARRGVEAEFEQVKAVLAKVRAGLVDIMGSM
jgi:hypothetical protein